MNDNGSQNSDLEKHEIEQALQAYKQNHPNACIKVQRQNNVSLRIRVIDPDFEGTDRVDREPEVWQALEALPDEIFQNITMLLLLAPSETGQSLANMEFENPVPSRL